MNHNNIYINSFKGTDMATVQLSKENNSNGYTVNDKRIDEIKEHIEGMYVSSTEVEYVINKFIQKELYKS